MQDGVLLGGPQLLIRRVQRETFVPRQRFGETKEGRIARQVRPGGQGALAQGTARVADEQGRGGALLNPQPLAARTPAERAVEGKVMRVQRLETATAAIAGEVLAEALDAPVRLGLAVLDVRDVHDAAAQVQTPLHRIGDARPLIGTHHHAIDHDLDEMLAAMIDGRRLFDVVRAAIDAHAHETAATNLVEEGVVLLLAAPFQRRHQVEFATLGQRQNSLDDLVGRLCTDVDLAVWTVGLTQTRVEDA